MFKDFYDIYLISHQSDDQKLFNKLISSYQNSSSCPTISFTFFQSIKEFHNREQSPNDEVIFVDESVSDIQSASVIKEVATVASAYPVIFLTSGLYEDYIENVEKNGGQDCLSKKGLTIELFKRSFYYSLQKKRDDLDRQVQEKKLLKSTEQISSLKKRLKSKANYVGLTGLPDRQVFHSILDKALKLAKRKSKESILLMVDLDNFALVNKKGGHSFGDKVIVETGKRLKKIVRESDVLAHLGGDEFAILMQSGINQTGAINLAKRIIKSLEKSFTVEGKKIALSPSIGVSIFPQDGNDCNNLLHAADLALSEAKESVEKISFYKKVSYQALLDELSLTNEIKKGLKKEQFYLTYQPKVDLFTKETLGYEALLRWEHPEKGFIPPDKFIPYAEKNNSIQDITYFVLKTAIKQCQQWHHEGKRLYISINISAESLKDEFFPEKIMPLLEEKTFPNSYIIFEITETAIISNFEKAEIILNKLHNLDIQISIDDFGMGHSSLIYLKNMPVNEVKIDKEFIINLDKSTDDQAIAKSIITLGHNLGVRIVAEGLENKESCDLLKAYGCDLAQGYYLGRPMKQEDISDWEKSSGWLTMKYSKAVSISLHRSR